MFDLGLQPSQNLSEESIAKKDIKQRLKNMTNALPVWKVNFAKFCAEKVKPEGNNYYADHFWLKNKRKNTERGLRIKQLSKKNIVQRRLAGQSSLSQGFFVEEVGSRMNMYHFKEHEKISKTLHLDLFDSYHHVFLPTACTNTLLIDTPFFRFVFFTV